LAKPVGWCGYQVGLDLYVSSAHVVRLNQHTAGSCKPAARPIEPSPGRTGHEAPICNFAHVDGVAHDWSPCSVSCGSDDPGALVALARRRFGPLTQGHQWFRYELGPAARMTSDGPASALSRAECRITAFDKASRWSGTRARPGRVIPPRALRGLFHIHRPRTSFSFRPVRLFRHQHCSGPLDPLARHEPAWPRPKPPVPARSPHSGPAFLCKLWVARASSNSSAMAAPRLKRDPRLTRAPG